MATREEIYQAILNADKAGDSESVRLLGAYLQTMDKQAPDSATEKKTGVLAALGKGAEGVVSSSKTALQSVFGDATEAGKQGLERGAKSQYADQIGLDKVKEAYNKDGLLSAAKEVGRQVPLAFAEQVPNRAASLLSARLGAMAGSVVGSVVPVLGTGAGALVGGGLGAFAPLLLQQLGGNVERQVAETGEAKLGSATAAAVPQAALDVVGNYIPLGKQLIGKLLGPEVAAVLKKSGKEAAEKLAKESLLKAAAKGTVVGGAAEIPTEVIQSALERAQAGLSVLSADAYKEYGETAYQASLLAPLGGAGRLVDRSAARAPAPADASQTAPVDAAAAAEKAAKAQAPARQSLLPNNNIFELASGPNGYAEVAKYKAGLLQGRQTPEVKAAVKEATDLLTLMTVEGVNRQREAEKLRANDRGLPTPETSAFNLPTEEATETATEVAPTVTAEAAAAEPKVRKRKGAKNVAVPPVVESGEATAIEQAGAGTTVPSVGVDSQPNAVTPAVQTEATGVGVSELPATDGNAPEELTGSTVTLDNGKSFRVVAHTDTMFALEDEAGNVTRTTRGEKLGRAVEAKLGIEPKVETPAETTTEQTPRTLEEVSADLQAGMKEVADLATQQQALLTKAGRVPAAKSPARAKWDALQLQIEEKKTALFPLLDEESKLKKAAKVPAVETPAVEAPTVEPKSDPFALLTSGRSVEGIRELEFRKKQILESIKALTPKPKKQVIKEGIDAPAPKTKEQLIEEAINELPQEAQSSLRALQAELEGVNERVKTAQQEESRVLGVAKKPSKKELAAANKAQWDAAKNKEKDESAEELIKQIIEAVGAYNQPTDDLKRRYAALQVILDIHSVTGRNTCGLVVCTHRFDDLLNQFFG